MSGRIQFVGNGKTIELGSGDSAIVKGNVEHWATALEDSEVLDGWTMSLLIAKTMPPHRGNIMWSGKRFLDETEIPAAGDVVFRSGRSTYPRISMIEITA